MNSRRSYVVSGIALALVVTAASARAYNHDAAADSVFPAWTAAEPLSGVKGVNTSSIFYEVRPHGTHEVELHFRNVSSRPLHFDCWFPGWQQPGDNARVSLPPSLGSAEEERVVVRLRHGRPGMSSAPMRYFALRTGPADEGPSVIPLAEVSAPPVPDDDWMPVVPLAADAVVRRSNLLARVVPAGNDAVLELRNAAQSDLHFRFAVPALGVTRLEHPRVSLQAGRDARILLRERNSPRPLPLLRVVVSDVRVGPDTGPLYAEDRSADVGWWSLTTADSSAALAHDQVLALVEPAEEGRARVRFRSRLGSRATLRFRVLGHQDETRENPLVTLEPRGEGEVVVPLDRPGGARLALARLRVWDVAHDD